MSNALEQAAIELAEAAMLLPDRPWFAYPDNTRPGGAFDINERFEAARAQYASVRASACAGTGAGKR